jgi:hypothetical protein
VALANNLTGGLQVEVSHEAWIGDNEVGEPTFDTPVLRKALHVRKTKIVRQPNQAELMSTSQLVFIGPIPEHGAEGRKEPLDPRDRFVFFNGESAKVLDVGGLDDPLTGRPYMYEVLLG